jgi:SAM-dependent methyltransferase
MNKTNLLDHYNSHDYAGTDKNNGHCYIQEYYDQEFSPRQHDELRVLEIGIYTGASIDLWGEYFLNSRVDGIDINPHFRLRNLNNNIHTHIVNASSEDALALFDNNTFDYIIDDGSHQIGDQLYVIAHWFDKLKAGGKLIIEDIQNDEYCNQLKFMSEKLGRSYKIFDMRHVTGRYDDVIFEVTK